MLNNCSPQLLFLNTINPARLPAHCLLCCFIACPKACCGLAVWFCCLEFSDPVVIWQLWFSEGEWSPGSTHSCPWPVLRAHKGKERPPKLRARQLNISFPKQCRWGILGLQEASSGEQVEPVVLGSGQGPRRHGLVQHMQVMESPERQIPAWWWNGLGWVMGNSSQSEFGLQTGPL